jgi:hypothetical protein
MNELIYKIFKIDPILWYHVDKQSIPSDKQICKLLTQTIAFTNFFKNTGVECKVQRCGPYFFPLLIVFPKLAHI